MQRLKRQALEYAQEGRSTAAIAAILYKYEVPEALIKEWVATDEAPI